MKYNITYKECDDDLYDRIAPFTQDTERRDQDEGSTNTHPDLTENYYLAEDLCFPSSSQNNEPLILNEMCDDNEYRASVQMLNKKQQEFFYHTLHLIKTCDKHFMRF